MTVASLPSGPTQSFPGQNLIRFRRDPIAFLRGMAREYGDVIPFKMGPQSMALINHPDLIREVLVTNNHQYRKGRGLQRAKRLLGEGLLTSEGAFHLRQRRLMQPAFHRQQIARYGAQMAECAVQTRSRWSDGVTLDIAPEMLQLTLAAVGRTLFDADIEAEAPEISDALTQVIHLFNLMMLPFSEYLEHLPLPAIRRFEQARSRLDATIYRLIAEHRSDGTDRKDLLSMLLAARDVEDDNGEMSDVQVRDEAMTIFIAGHETTANALTWTWYLLSQHPEVEAKLHAELDTVLAGRTPSAEDMPNLPYTRMVLSESFRLYPPAWIIGRQALGECVIGDHTLPDKTIVLLCQAVTHVDRRYWPDPMRFYPERWDAASETDRPKFAYFPFGGGSRVCIGEQFAWMEGVLLLATLAQQWRMELVPGHPVVTQPIVTLRPKHGMRMVLHRRG